MFMLSEGNIKNDRWRFRKYKVQDNCMSGSKNQYHIDKATHAALYFNVIRDKFHIQTIYVEKSEGT